MQQRARPRAGLFVSARSHCICNVTAVKARAHDAGIEATATEGGARVPAKANRDARTDGAARVLRALAAELDALAIEQA